MPIKPPIVWHLDTDNISTFSYNPDDRLTRIRDVMKEFEDEKKSLKQTLKEIEEICAETNSSESEDPALH